ncbi:MAG: bifunctional 2-C-methyl-D-erythritol 4-phosphate cytidylyltransferase/2-C-methyl-D-erythritol 2,4-cyclodiphosphate synthase [Chakrabartia sp.]
MKIAALIVAAGQGLRAGGDVPKQYALLGDKPLLAHSVAAFAAHPAIARIILVIGAGQEALAQQALGPQQVDRLVIGGAERQHSVRAGLRAIDDCDVVLVHDAARPLLPAAVIDRLIAAMATRKAAIPVLPVVDTLAREDNGLLGDGVSRTSLMRVQTPQAAYVEILEQAHALWTGDAATDDAQMIRALGIDVALVEGDAMLEKVTQAADFSAAHARLAPSLISRSAMGYDVHRLAAGEELWLAGVKIAHDKGLAGHSDADVALHALTDALLGTLGDGDIGAHFPPSDPQWRGAASHRFVAHAAGLIRSAGGIIDHVDLTIICEAPKIGPHRPAMRARVAEILGLSENRVSIKATTTEKLGFTGRGEGIAAQAIATVRLPEDR